MRVLVYTILFFVFSLLLFFLLVSTCSFMGYCPREYVLISVIVSVGLFLAATISYVLVVRDK